jgi:hypothetical protein
MVSLDLYLEAENLYYNKIYKNEKLPVERRHHAIVAIFNFPPFYKPKLKLSTDLLKKLSELLPGCPDNAQLTDIFLAQFDKRPKFAFYDMKQKELPKYQQEVIEFLGIAKDSISSMDLSNDIAVSQLLQK